MSLLSVGVDVVLVVVAVAALGWGAARFVAGASRLAGRAGLSGLVIGLTVVAFGTSAPEFAVTVDAALGGRADVAVANVVGSNVFNLGIVLGAVALVRTLPTHGDLVRRDGVVLVATTLVLVWVVRDLRVGRVEGVVLFGSLVAYLLVVVSTDRERPVVSAVDDAATVPEAAVAPATVDPSTDVSDEASGETAAGAPPDTTWLRDLFWTVVGLASVVAGAHLLVESAAALARVAGLSEWLIGVTVVAAGTSAPEFATSVAAARRGAAGLSAGNLVGSSIFNTLGVLGLAASIQPLSVAAAAVESSVWLLVLVAVATVLLWSGRELTRAEGAVLVALGLVNWAVDVVG
ncbi:calcium/sodium antiporter [Halobaculum sp. MBLA0147]|uniref:calcium/sodium antiporter n=1 Tax=Halobaculum sp. MBLA0147 TaxID=3079934 RepID=UPI003524B046